MAIMKITAVLCAILPLLTLSFAATTCTVSPLGSGKDDAPNFLSMVKSSACSTIEIPTGKTLNISSAMDLTGLQNKHIALQGTIKFNPNIDYWTANAFPFAFQTQIAFWMLGGQNVTLDGGGTLDGSGQAWYDGFAKDSSLARPILLTIYEGTDVTIRNHEDI